MDDGWTDQRKFSGYNTAVGVFFASFIFPSTSSRRFLARPGVSITAARRQKRDNERRPLRGSYDR